MFALVLAWLSGTAVASYTLEAPPFADKSEAASLNKDARSTGHKGRVIRRFKDGEGWEYVVRWTLETSEEASKAATAISATIGAPLVMRDGEGKLLEQLPAPPVVDDAPPEEVPAGRDWLAEALETHGAGIAMLADAEVVKVVFERSFADGRNALHTSVRRGTDLYVAIEPIAGDVVASTTVAVGDEAWLETKGKKTKHDLQRTREKLETFGLSAIVPLVLELDRLPKKHPELIELVARGTAKLGSEPCEVAGTKDGATLIAFNDDHVIRRVSVDNGGRTVEFHDYKEIDDVMIPHKIVTTVDGKPRDTVIIKSIETNVDVPEAWFVGPG